MKGLYRAVMGTPSGFYALDLRSAQGRMAAIKVSVNSVKTRAEIIGHIAHFAPKWLCLTELLDGRISHYRSSIIGRLTLPSPPLLSPPRSCRPLFSPPLPSHIPSPCRPVPSPPLHSFAAVACAMPNVFARHDALQNCNIARNGQHKI